MSFIHSDTVSPVKEEKPKMKRFRDEFMSTNCRLLTPTATIRPAEGGAFMSGVTSQGVTYSGYCEHYRLCA